ncbi:sugar ABC transporter permease [Bifidobacterium goeldii]|uniref:Sugar ABC transporter permease n=1 Tax=Bifidobacterium goeldii TaxID=2306975 RepID=A0A430FL27_9BIFI|nr:carbohydrate ABC transporter permease [Bifidobacterium goeldii]RSX53599.1 sugar ABC transporter permease [Bifidobacterium goeldii]
MSAAVSQTQPRDLKAMRVTKETGAGVLRRKTGLRRSAQVKHGMAIKVSLWSRILVWVVFIVAFFYFVVPALWLFVAATKNAGELYTTGGFEFAHFRLWENIRNLFTYRGGIFARWILNSVIYSGFGSVITALVSAMCGYALYVYEFRGKKIIMGALMASLLIPATVIAQPVYLLLIQLGLGNTMAGVLLPSFVYPFGVMLCYITAQSSVPKEIIEAARIDGAGEFRTFFRISMPMMMTGLATVFLFAFMQSWNSYMMPLMVLDDPNLYPVTVGLVDWRNQSSSVAALGTLTITGAFVSIIPLILIFLATQK